MASGLSKRRAAGYLAVLLPLWGLCLVRLWALLGGRVPGKLIALLALLPAALALLVSWRLELDKRLLQPFQNGLVTLLVGSLSFLLGGLLDVSYAMVDAAGTLLDYKVFHVLSSLGSAVVCAALVLALCTAKRAWGKVEAGSKWQMLVLFLLVNALALFYLRGSATVYIWDNAGYWSTARALADQPFGLTQLREVARTTVSLDYNHILALPISWLMRLLGGSRAVFVLAIVNLYLLPALWGLCALGRRRRWGGAVLALLFPALAYLALVGFVDVAAAAVAIWAVVFYTRPEAPGWAGGLLAGACLAVSFLLRRYFLFFAAAFGLAALLRAVCIRTRRERRAFGCLFAACAAWAVYLTQQFLVDKLTTNYTDIYSAYAAGLRSDVMLFCRYFGYLTLAAALLLGLWRLVRRSERWSDALFAMAQLAACFLLLTRVQSHGQQHTLLYVPCLALLLAPDGPPEARWKQAAAGCAGAVCTLVCLLPRPQPASIAAIRVPDPVPGFSFHGPRRADIQELLALSDYLDALAAESEAPVTCGVFASSLLLNTDTLPNLRPSLNLPEAWDAMEYIYVASVDKRDAFSWAALDADYLVVGDPVQVHLGEENQQIVALVAHQVLEGSGLGTAFAREDVRFTLADGAQVYVYRRTREITPQERRGLSQALIALYPDHAGLYQAP